MTMGGDRLCCCFQPRMQKKLLSCCIYLMYYLSLPSSVLQLPQPGASLDNRVPTPAPAASADLHAQHVGADLPVKEVKAEPHQETGGKTEPKMEVSLALCIPNLIYLPVY